MALNPYQRLAADTYAGGEFSHIQHEDEATDVGDTLFLFLIRELDDDCDSWEEATNRLQRARDDIDGVLSEVENHG